MKLILSWLKDPWTWIGALLAMCVFFTTWMLSFKEAESTYWELYYRERMLNERLMQRYMQYDSLFSSVFTDPETGLRVR